MTDKTIAGTSSTNTKEETAKAEEKKNAAPPKPVKKGTTVTTVAPSKPPEPPKQIASTSPNPPVTNVTQTPTFANQYNKDVNPPAVSQSKVDEIVARIKAAIKDLEEKKYRDHVAALLMWLVPKEKHIARAKTLMEVLKIDAKTAKAVNDSLGDLINFGKHPGLDKFDFGEKKEYRETIKTLKEKVGRMTHERSEFAAEAHKIENQLIESKYGNLGLAQEASKVLNFIKNQLDVVTADNARVIETQDLNFLRRTLKNEVEIFARAEAEALKLINDISTDDLPSSDWKNDLKW